MSAEKCSAIIGFQLTKDKKALFISKLCEYHNHHINRSKFARDFATLHTRYNRESNRKSKQNLKKLEEVKDVEEEFKLLRARNAAAGVGGEKVQQLLVGDEFDGAGDIELAVGNHEMATCAKYIKTDQGGFVVNRHSDLYEWIVYSCNNYGRYPTDDQRGAIEQLMADGVADVINVDKEYLSRMLCPSYLIFIPSPARDKMVLSQISNTHIHNIDPRAFLKVALMFEANREWDKAGVEKRKENVPSLADTSEQDEELEGEDTEDTDIEEVWADVTHGEVEIAEERAIVEEQHFSPEEVEATNLAILDSIIGAGNVDRWNHIKEEMGFTSEPEFVTWMLETVERHHMRSANDDMPVKDATASEDDDKYVDASEYFGVSDVHHEEEVNTAGAVPERSMEIATQDWDADAEEKTQEDPTQSQLPKPGFFPCQQCRTVFFKERGLSIHMAHCKIQNLPSVVICTICGEPVKRRKIVVHNRAHMQKDKFSCRLCRKEFPHTKASYERHMYHTHGVMMLQCEVCGAPKGTTLMLEKHMERAHGISDMASVQCEQCGKAYKNRISLYIHNKTVHSGKIYQCPFCYHETLVFCNLKKHMQVMHKHDVGNHCSMQFEKRVGKMKLVHTGNGVMKYKPTGQQEIGGAGVTILRPVLSNSDDKTVIYQSTLLPE